MVGPHVGPPIEKSALLVDYVFLLGTMVRRPPLSTTKTKVEGPGGSSISSRHVDWR